MSSFPNHKPSLLHGLRFSIVSQPCLFCNDEPNAHFRLRIFELMVVPGGMQSTFVGPTDFLFPRFQLALQGERFVVAVHIEKLAVLYTKVMKKHPVDILDFIEFVQKQSSSVLRQADAVWASLRPGPAMIVPPGWFVSEGSLALMILSATTSTPTHLIFFSFLGLKKIEFQ